MLKQQYKKMTIGLFPWATRILCSYNPTRSVTQCQQSSGSSSPNASKDQQLRQRIQEAEINARKLGVIHTIENTAETFTASDGTRFQVRVATALQSKPLNCGPKEDRAKSPFLRPIENGILICALSETHNLLFNKFNVMKNHVLICTKYFESQEEPLTQIDLDAVQQVLSAFESDVGDEKGSLAFFNCGKNSGFSQPHKHVQVEEIFS